MPARAPPARQALLNIVWHNLRPHENVPEKVYAPAQHTKAAHNGSNNRQRRIMTDLHIGFIALGLLLVLGMYAYNRWQEKRQQRIAEAMLQPEKHEDVLLGENRSSVKTPHAASTGDEHHPREPRQVLSTDQNEPHFANISTVADAPSEATPSTVTPPASPLAQPQTPAPQPRHSVEAVPASTPPLAASAVGPPEGVSQPVPLPETLLSPRIDGIVEMRIDTLPALKRIAQSLGEHCADIAHAIHWAVYDENNLKWTTFDPDDPPGDGQICHHYALGLQLVNRNGPLKEKHIQAFFQTVGQCVDDPELRVKQQPAEDELVTLSGQLEQFCVEVDIRIGINLMSVSGAGLPGARIQTLAESCGLVISAQAGCYERRNSAGALRFQLHNLEPHPLSNDTLTHLNTKGLTFLLDTPCTPNAAMAFDEMVKVAKDFAPALGGRLVDDNGQPLSEPQLRLIRSHYIEKTVARMEDDGITAGSALALRLFSLPTTN